MGFDQADEFLSKSNVFGDREVGLTHPDNAGYIKIADNGDIHIMAKEGIGIIISAAQNCIFLVGDYVKFLTKEDEGLRLNNLAFNVKATTYSEPAFIVPKNQSDGIYAGVTNFFS